ncbi:MAG: hypothetical protein ACTTIZ_03110 [Treponema sp.]
MPLPNEKKTDTKPSIELVTERKSVKDGLGKCYDDLDNMAKKTPNIPENTRSNPADRVKRFREEINYKDEDSKKAVLTSEMFKQSAILLVHCVLSPLYGKNISLKYNGFGFLKGQNKELEGRLYFLNKMQEALYDGNGLKIDDNSLIRIYNDEKLIGLFSSSGPIPSIDCRLLNKDYDEMFLKHLKTNGDDVIASLVKSLKEQEKELLSFYLRQYKDFIGNCCLFIELQEKLKEFEPSSKIERNFKVDSSKRFSFPTLKEDSKDNNMDILFDRLIILPIGNRPENIGEEDYKPKGFGYSLKKELGTLSFNLDTLYYACIPPLKRNVVEWINNERFKLTSISIDKNKSEIGCDVKSLFIECNAELDGIEFYYSRNYIGEKLQFIDNFPALDLYGIAPKFGFLARRDIEGSDVQISPLENKKKMSIGEISNVRIEDTEFESIDETYKYSLHIGNIPEWAGIEISGDWCGALPLRAGSIKDETDIDWKNRPPFIHKRFPDDGKMQVAIDIGSSRSIVLFKKDGINQDKFDSKLMEQGLELAIPITESLYCSEDLENVPFKRDFFEPSKVFHSIEGKNKLSIVFTNKKDKNQLYKAGKLFFLDANIVQKIGDRVLFSDIKSKIKLKTREADNNKSNVEDEASNAKKAMLILIQGLLSLIIEKSIRYGCSKIDIRTAYLREHYSGMKEIWHDAITCFKDVIRTAKIKTVSHNDKDSDVVSGGLGGLDIVVTPYLPESLAIANALCVEGFRAIFGAAIVDIGDYSTDIAILKNSNDDSANVELLGNLSIYFGGRVIFLQTIWDYLKTLIKHGSVDKAKNKIGSIFGSCITDDGILKKLENALKENFLNEKVPNNVRDILLCMIPSIASRENDFQDMKLRDLIYLGYLAQILILKHCIEGIEKDGVFNIYLFGGGSFCFKGQKVGNSDGFNWQKVLEGRNCQIFNRHLNVDMLAAGLFIDINEKFKDAANKKEDDAIKYKGSQATDRKFPGKEELEDAYRDFLENARKLKSNWSFSGYIYKDGTKDFAGAKLDKNDEFIRNKDGKVKIEPIDNIDIALEFAGDCMPGDWDVEIVKILFAYRMTYLSVINQYEKYGD